MAGISYIPQSAQHRDVQQLLSAAGVPDLVQKGEKMLSPMEEFIGLADS